MKKQLIMSAATGYTPKDLSLFIESLAQTGFKGVLLLLVNESTAWQAVKNKYPFTLETYVVEKRWRRFHDFLDYRRFHGPKLLAYHKFYSRTVSSTISNTIRQALWTSRFGAFYLHIACSRWGYYLRWLWPRRKRFSQVLLSDSRDAAFQSNPFSMLQQDDCLLLAAEPENQNIGNEGPNTTWIRTLYGDEMISNLAGRTVCCSGTTLGKINAIIDYLSTMVLELNRLAIDMHGCHGFDQGVHNVLLHTDKLPKARLLGNHEGPFFTMAEEPVQNVVINKQGSVSWCGKNTPALLHQFDRHPALLNILQQKHHC